MGTAGGAAGTSGGKTRTEATGGLCDLVRGLTGASESESVSEVA